MSTCNKCGKSLDDDFKICPYCGQPVEKEPEKEASQQNGFSCFTYFVIFLVIVAVLISIILNVRYWANENSSDASSLPFIGDKNSSPTLLTRPAKNSDLSISSSLNLSALGADLNIRSDENIYDLRLKLNFYDKNNNLISTKYHTLGYVEAGVEAKVTLSLTDFNIVDIFKIETVSVEVSNGYIKYFD